MRSAKAWLGFGLVVLGVGLLPLLEGLPRVLAIVAGILLVSLAVGRLLADDDDSYANDFTNRNTTLMTWNLLTLRERSRTPAASPRMATNDRPGTPAAGSTFPVRSIGDAARGGRGLVVPLIAIVQTGPI